MNINRPEWTAEENAKLYELISQGLDDAEIGIQLGKTTGAIRGRRQRLHIPRPVQRGYIWSDAQDARLTVLWVQSMATQHIALALAEEFGRPLTKNSVIGRAHRLKLSNRKVGCLGDRKPRIKTAHLRSAEKAKLRKTPRPPAEDHVWQLFGELQESACRFIQGDARGPETLMCGLPKEKGSYCQYHHWMTHLKPSRASRAVTIEAALP